MLIGKGSIAFPLYYLISPLFSFLEFVIAMFYVRNINARCKAISDLSLCDFEELKSRGVTTSTSFKTSFFYSYQGVSCNAATLRYIINVLYLYICDACFRYVQFWVDIFRPLVASATSGESLFVNSQGTKLSSPGEYVTRFFTRVTDGELHMTTTVRHSSTNIFYVHGRISLDHSIDARDRSSHCRHHWAPNV